MALSNYWGAPCLFIDDPNVLRIFKKYLPLAKVILIRIVQPEGEYAVHAMPNCKLGPGTWDIELPRNHGGGNFRPILSTKCVISYSANRLAEP